MPFITYLLIGSTVLISLAAFNNGSLFHQLKHYPYAESRRHEYHRWLSSGFLHGDQMHLLFNMLTLYFFGPRVESIFEAIFPKVGHLLYLAFYLLAVIASSAGTYFKHKDNPGFASIGASGAISAVLFADILFEPTNSIYLMFLPIPIYGFIFGFLYLWYSSYAANRSNDSIDHMAHFYGAVFGFLFPLVFKPSIFLYFIEQVKNLLNSFF